MPFTTVEKSGDTLLSTLPAETTPEKGNQAALPEVRLCPRCGDDAREGESGSPTEKGSQNRVAR